MAETENAKPASASSDPYGIGEAVKAVFDKFSNFFDILDLSFFVSGAAAASAIWFLCRRYGLHPTADLGQGTTATVVLACYILGLFCFVVGRTIRQEIDRRIYPNRYEKAFKSSLESHGLHKTEPYKTYLDRDDPKSANKWLHAGRLYGLAWTDVRQNDALKISYALINRYWVLSATFDGLVSAILLWGGVIVSLALTSPKLISVAWAFGVVLVLLGLCGLCMKEAHRYRYNQVEELVATLAYKALYNVPNTPTPSATQPTAGTPAP
jgi:hypothetical protein